MAHLDLPVNRGKLGCKLKSGEGFTYWQNMEHATVDSEPSSSKQCNIKRLLHVK